MGQLVIKHKKSGPREVARPFEDEQVWCPCYFTNGTIEMQKEEVAFAGAQESEDDSLPFVFVCGS